MNKGIVLGMVILVIGMGFTGTSYSLSISKSQMSTIKGNILYVGGSGPGNYSTIQDAVNDSSDGDTVFVYNYSSPYYENIILDKSLDLVGEDKNSTIIDGEGKSKSIVLIAVNDITIRNFKIQNCRSLYGVYAGIKISKGIHNILIEENIVQNSFRGIYVDYSAEKRTYNTVIKSNYFYNNHYAIQTGGISSNVINNLIIDNKCGIDINSIGSLIKGNIISGSERGISIGTDGGYFCTFILNNITNNQIGIQLFTVTSNKFKKNNFIGNQVSATFYTDIPFFINKWSGNYWDDLGNKEIYIINGIWRFQLFAPYGKLREILWYNFDFHPAKEPYNITTAQGCGLE